MNNLIINHSKTFIRHRLKLATFLITVLFPVPNAEAARFPSNGAVIDYQVSGSGAPVFILHGGLTSREDLRVQIDHLAHNYRVVALDSREHGYSSGSPHPISYELMASDIANLSTHLGFKRISIMGQSDGGITALTFAALYPAKVDKLILLGATFNHSGISEATKRTMKNTKWPLDMDRTRFPGIYLDDYLKGGRKMVDYQGWFDKLAHMWITSPNFTRQDLTSIKVPILVVNGDHEDVPLDHTLALYKALPNAQLFTVPGATHFLHREKPDLLNLVINDFLSDIQPASK